MRHWLISQISQCLWGRTCLEYECKDHPYSEKVNVIHEFSERGLHQTSYIHKKSFLLIFWSHFQNPLLMAVLKVGQRSSINSIHAQCGVIRCLAALMSFSLLFHCISLPLIHTWCKTGNHKLKEWSNQNTPVKCNTVYWYGILLFKCVIKAAESREVTSTLNAMLAQSQSWVKLSACSTSHTLTVFVLQLPVRCAKC